MYGAIPGAKGRLHEKAAFMKMAGSVGAWRLPRADRATLSRGGVYCGRIAARLRFHTSIHHIMAHIALPEGLPGITALLAFRPETAAPLNALADALLTAPSTLSRAERELIATYVSYLNGCTFCHNAHGAAACHHLEGRGDIVDAVRYDYPNAPVSDKLKALLAIAGKVQQSGRSVTAADVAGARAGGATDVEIHDAVLIAAAFCMYNRYVDGLATWAPSDPAAYAPMGESLATRGYSAAG